MAHYDISDKHFQFRCCWTCKHCLLDIAQGYLCVASDRLAIPLVAPGQSANEVLHQDRRNCKAYCRG